MWTHTHTFTHTYTAIQAGRVFNPLLAQGTHCSPSCFCYWAIHIWGHSHCERTGGSDGKASACKAGDAGLIPGSGRSPAEGNGNPLQHSCLENPMDRGAWWATVHGVAKSQTRLSDFSFLLSTVKIEVPHFNSYEMFHWMACCLVLSHIQLSVTPWAVAQQAPLSMGISRQEYWSGLSFPSPRDLSNPGIAHASPSSILHCRQILYHWATREVLSPYQMATIRLI